MANYHATHEVIKGMLILSRQTFWHVNDVRDPAHAMAEGKVFLCSPWLMNESRWGAESVIQAKPREQWDVCGDAIRALFHLPPMGASRG